MLHLLEIPKQKTKTPGNSASFLINPMIFDMLFLQNTWKSHVPNPSFLILFRFFWNSRPFCPQSLLKFSHISIYRREDPFWTVFFTFFFRKATICKNFFFKESEILNRKTKEKCCCMYIYKYFYIVSIIAVYSIKLVSCINNSFSEYCTEYATMKVICYQYSIRIFYSNHLQFNKSI